MKQHTKFLDKLREKGFTAKDIPKAILFQELMYGVWLAMTWTTCYFFPPTQLPFLKKPIEAIMAKMPQKLSNSLAGNGFLTSRFGQAYVESSCLRKLMRPFSFPAGIIITIKLLEMSSKWDFTQLEQKFERFFKKKTIMTNPTLDASPAIDVPTSFPGIEKVKFKSMDVFGNSKPLYPPMTITMNSLGNKIFI